MNREFLVLIESEVESRDAWITKNEAKMNLPPDGNVQDLEGFLQLKEAHDVSTTFRYRIHLLIAVA